MTDVTTKADEPEIDDGRMDGRVEPIACNAVAPRARIAGVDTTAPPMPNIPDSTPVATPTSTVIATSSHSGIGGTYLLRFPTPRNGSGRGTTIAA